MYIKRVLVLDVSSTVVEAHGMTVNMTNDCMDVYAAITGFLLSTHMQITDPDLPGQEPTE